ncbi:RhuM family protein [Leucobacter massiliensis]|uniref:Death-on-curing family protein n=1 Tax=Leucobacter massiliensis TaxID=1686285 RepID=A0A2S9QKC2_9MICO|nr:RhuM family protein [Leucobacter massiliensis]PRI10041.1 death-on-curing family protein [Leucobacter massiliensis]PRI10046.1 death-on-curing family protein [Leucobacter massiliensis]
MSSLELYTSHDGTVSLEVRADHDTVWLTRQQLATLFGRDVKTIGKHIANARREELEGVAVVAKFATTATDGKTYRVEHYNLDLALSVGYRVKSPEGVYFRRWATDVLRRYLLEGVAVNESRLRELGQIVQILSRSSDELVAGVADVLAEYLPSLTLLRDYDEGSIDTAPCVVPGWTLTLDEARSVIAHVADEFPDDGLLGRERGDALGGVVGAIYQGFDGQDLYPTVEEKAANLLYLVVKDHPLSDGNKRSAAALFITFLARNGMLASNSGAPCIANNTLAAITLMVAMSDPKEKDLMIALLIRMITGRAA